MGYVNSDDPLGLIQSQADKKKPASSVLDDVLHPEDKLISQLMPKSDKKFDPNNPLGLPAPKKVKKPQKLSGPPKDQKADFTDYPAYQVSDRPMTPRELSLRNEQANLQKYIRQQNAKGYDVRGLQQRLFDIHTALKSYGGFPYKQPPIDDKAVQATLNPPQQQGPPAPDPFDQLDFSRESYEHSINHGLSTVQTRAGGEIGIRHAMQMVAKREGRQAGEQMTESPEQVEAEDTGQVRNLRQEHLGNPNRKRLQEQFKNAGTTASAIAGVPSGMYEQATGLSPEDAPYAHAALNFLGSLAASPISIAAGIKHGVQNPIGAIQNAPSTVGDLLSTVNVFDPNISGPERFERSLNAILALEGGVKGFQHLIKNGTIDQLGAKMGVESSRVKIEIKNALDRYNRVNDAKVDNAARLNKVASNEKARAARQVEIDDPLGIDRWQKLADHIKQSEEAEKAAKPAAPEAAPLAPKGKAPKAPKPEAPPETPKPAVEKPKAAPVPASYDEDDLESSNNAYIDKAKKAGLKPKAIAHLENIAEDDHNLHDAWHPDTIEKVAKSKLSGRRQVNALEFLSTNGIERPDLVDRTIKYFEETPVRLGDYGEGDNQHTSTSTPAVYRLRDNNGPRDIGHGNTELDKIFKEQHDRSAPEPETAPETETKKTPAAPKPTGKAPVAEAPKAPEPETPRPAPEPKSAPEPKVKKPKAEPEPEKPVAPPAKLPDQPSGVKSMTQGLRAVVDGVIDDDGYVTQKSVADKARVTQGVAYKALKEAEAKGIVAADPETGGYKLTETGKRLHAEKSAAKSGIRPEQRPGWLKIPKVNGLENSTRGWYTGEVNGKPWRTNSHLAVEGDVPKGQGTDGTKRLDIARVVPARSPSWREIGKPVAYHESTPGTHVDTFADGTRANSAYLRHVEEAHPGGKWYRTDDSAGGSKRPLAYEVNGETKGVVMPMAPDGFTPEGTRAILDEHEPDVHQSAVAEKPSRSAEQPKFKLNESHTNPSTAPATGTSTSAVPYAKAEPTPAGSIPRLAQTIKKVLSPASVSKNAGVMADLLRQHGGELHRRALVVENALKQARGIFAKMPEAEAHQFIDDLENGRPQSDPTLQPFADAFRHVLDTKRDQVRALGTGKLENFYQNYFPHLWGDPAKAQTLFERLMSKKPLQGNKNFLKERTIPLYMDGIRAGLKPKYTNPVDVVTDQAQEMDRYIVSQRLLADMKARGFTQYVRVGAERPEGYETVPDSLFTVYHSGEIPIHEAFDQRMMDQLNKLARDLGVRTTRGVKLDGVKKRGVWGTEQKGPGPKTSRVQTKFGGPESVFVHELGHSLDRIFGLKAKINAAPNGAKLWAEGKKLAEYRWEGGSASANYERYAKNKSEVLANLMDAYVRNPELAKKVAPNLYKWFDGFVKSEPRLKQITDIKPSLVLGDNTTSVRAPGIHTLGNYMVPTDVATVLNRYLGPGLQGGARDLLDAYQKVNNTMNQFNLALSGFHAVGTSFNSMATEVSLGLQDLSRLRLVSGTKHIVGGMLPTTVIRDFRVGKALREEFVKDIPNPKVQRIIDSVVAGGGRVGTPAEYTNQAVRAFTDAFASKSYIKAGIKAPSAVVELIGSPLMQHFVPNVKLGAFSHMMEYELNEAGPNITEDQFRRTAAKMWDSVDNRFGQIVYDNLFWSKTARQLAQASIRSVGWNLGSFREAGGALMDYKNTTMHTPTGHRLTYCMALPIVVGTYGAALHYMLTGKHPESALDCFFPRTGKKNPDGSDERLSIPSYIKDVFGFAHDPVHTVTSKLAPELTAVADFLNNADYRNQKVYNEDDPFYKKGLDVLKHAAEDFEPFSFQQQIKEIKEKGSPNYAAFMGFNKAPSYVGRSPAMEQALKYMTDALPKGARTSEEAAVSTRNSDIVGLLRNNQTDKAFKAMQDAKLNKKQIRTLVERAALPGLAGVVKRLQIGQAVNVYRIASPEEKKQIAGVVIQKLKTAKKNRSHPPEELQKMFEEFTQAGADAEQGK